MERGGVFKVGQFVYDWDQTQSLKLCVSVSVRYVCFYSARSLSAACLSQILWHLCQTKQLLGKSGGKLKKLGSVQNFYSWTNSAIHYVIRQQPLEQAIDHLNHKPFFVRCTSVMRLLCALSVGHDKAFDLQRKQPLDNFKVQARFKAQW